MKNKLTFTEEELNRPLNYMIVTGSQIQYERIDVDEARLYLQAYPNRRVIVMGSDDFKYIAEREAIQSVKSGFVHTLGSGAFRYINPDGKTTGENLTNILSTFKNGLLIIHNPLTVEQTKEILKKVNGKGIDVIIYKELITNIIPDEVSFITDVRIHRNEEPQFELLFNMLEPYFQQQIMLQVFTASFLCAQFISNELHHEASDEFDTIVANDTEDCIDEDDCSKQLANYVYFDWKTGKTYGVTRDFFKKHFIAFMQMLNGNEPADMTMIDAQVEGFYQDMEEEKEEYPSEDYND